MRLRRTAAAALAAMLVGASPSPAPAPTGITAHGTITAAVTFSGTSLPIGGQIALYRRGTAYRLDVLSIDVPGADAGIGAVATQFLAPGGITLLYDTTSSAYTLYSNGTRRYYTGRRSGSAVAAAPATLPTGATASDPFSGFGAVTRTLANYQTFSLTTSLMGRGPVNGHPATKVDLNLADQRVGGTPENVHLQLALADDLEGFPVQLGASRTGSGGNDVTGSARIDVTAIDKTPPPPSTFAIPAGYTRSDDIPSVLRPI